MYADETWQGADGTYYPYDPALAAQYPGDLTWEEAAFTAGGLVGMAAFPIAVEYVAGQIVWPALTKTGGTIAGWFCRDGDCTNEYRPLLDRIMSLRRQYSIGWNRNVATANYNIGGNTGTLNAVSGEAPRGGQFVEVVGERIFVTEATRAFDTEVKILESLATRFASNPSVKGTITLFTERPPCPSCLGVIQQFEAMFANIDIKILSEIFGG